MATNIWVNLPVESGAGSGITDINGATGPSVSIVAGVGISVGTVGNTITITNTTTDTGITQLTGDVTAGPGSGSQVATLATVNANVGSFGSSTSIPNFTVNAKGLITAAGSNVVIAPAGTLTGTTLAANVVTSSLTSVGTIVTGVWNGTVIDVAHGGTSLATLTANNVILGNGTSAPLFVAPGSSGNVLTSNGTTWSSSAPASSGVTTVGSIDTNANSNALFISGATISTQSASATNPGMVNNTTQTLSGNKTFSGDTISKSLKINGTGGAGFVNYVPQSSSPSTPASGFNEFADNTNRPTWENTSGFLTTFDNTGITASRVYTLRDVSGKFLLDSRWSAAATTLTTGTTTILSNDAFALYLLDSTSGSITVNLPTAASVADRVYIFKGISGNMETNNFILVPSGTDKIEGLNVNKIFQTNYGAWTLVSDGVASWWMV